MPSRWDDSEILEKSLNGKRIKIRFYCEECDHYTTVWLSLGLVGNHVMNCPNCGHRHDRVVRNGQIVSDRYDSSLPFCHEIIATKSACMPAKDAPPLGKIAAAREAEAAGQMT